MRQHVQRETQELSFNFVEWAYIYMYVWFELTWKLNRDAEDGVRVSMFTSCGSNVNQNRIKQHH